MSATERKPTPAIMRLLAYAEQSGGTFKMWPTGIAHVTVKRATTGGWIERLPSRPLDLIPYGLTEKGRIALAEHEGCPS